MNNLYRVVFTGRLRTGIPAEQAARDFASVFKVPEEKAWKLVLDGNEHVLKKEVDQGNAERYMQILEEIGLEIRIDPLDPSAAPAHPTPPPPRSQAPTPPPISPQAQPGPSGATFPPSGDSAARDVANPYAPPNADLTPPPIADAMGPMTGPVQVDAGHGWSWIAWAYQDHFRQAPGAWIGAFLFLGVLSMLLGLIPIIGGLINAVIGPIFLGGLMFGAQCQERGQRFEFNHLFTGFSQNAGRLAAVGGLYLLAILVVTIVAMVFGGVLGGLLAAGMDPQAFQSLDSADPAAAMAVVGPVTAIVVLVVLAAIIPVVMAYWFAPALVMLAGMRPVEAMILSFRGCLRNILPFLVYGLIVFGLVFIAILPFFLGLLILSPILMASMYTAYRDIYFGPRR
jgi:uncharacterized membrane protein